jgi:hypothetical protein
VDLEVPGSSPGGGTIPFSVLNDDRPRSSQIVSARMIEARLRWGWPRDFRCWSPIAWGTAGCVSAARRGVATSLKSRNMRFAALTQTGWSSCLLQSACPSTNFRRKAPWKRPGPPIGNGSVVTRRDSPGVRGFASTFLATTADLLPPPSRFTVMNRTPVTGSKEGYSLKKRTCQERN